MKEIKIIISIVYVLLSGGLFGQSITLDEALLIASENYNGIRYDQLYIDKQKVLANGGSPQQLTQIFISGEEFDFKDQRGIHSLNVQQNFNLPKVGSAYKSYYSKNAELGEARLALTRLELEKEIKMVFFELLYTQEYQKLQESSIAIYEDFLSVTTKLSESGETGAIPQLAAKTQLSKAKLEKEHANERNNIAKALFNSWLDSDDDYDAKGSLQAVNNEVTVESKVTPHLLFYDSQKAVANANVEIKNAQLIPQLNTGLRLQSIGNDFPFFGYQFGVNVPLFRNGINKQIEASKLELEMIDSQKKLQAQKMNRRLSELEYRKVHQGHIIEKMTDELMPIIENQVELTRRAFLEGESSYLDYLNALKEQKDAKEELLEELYRLKMIEVEIDYWQGN